MNAAFLLLGAAIATPLAAFEVRRKWLDWRFSRRVRSRNPVCGCGGDHENGAIR